MNERKRQILQAITDDYIASAEPVGSRTIARKYDLGVSPATIRNEMADLEEAGYLEQPHTSAGRIPSDKGYRYYVDSLMDPLGPTEAERTRLQLEVRMRQRAMEQMIHRTARLLSLLTQYMAVIAIPGASAGVCRHMQLVRLDDHHVLLVLITEPGFVHNRLVEVAEPMADADINRANEIFSQRLHGISAGDVTTTLIGELRLEVKDSGLFRAVLELLTAGLDRPDDDKLFFEGTTNLFDHPEFHDVERVKTLLGLLDDRSTVLDMLNAGVRHQGTQVTIGAEHTHKELHQCSIVTATYSQGGHVVGTLGLIGPTRMQYSRVVGVLQFVADGLSEAISDAAGRA